MTRPPLAMVSNEEKRASTVPKIPTEKPAGNSKADQRWMDQEIEAERLWQIDPSEWDLSWDALYMHDWTSEEVYDAYPKPTFQRKTSVPCTGTSYLRDERGGYIVDRDGERLTRPCLRAARPGGKVCDRHGGNAPWIKAAAERRLMESTGRAADTLVELLDPVDKLGSPIAHKDRIKASTEVLDRGGIRGGTEVEVGIPKYKQVVDKLFSDDDDNDS